MTAAQTRKTKARVVGRVLEVAVENAASLQSSLPQKQVEGLAKVSSPMSKVTPGYFSVEDIFESNLVQHLVHLVHLVQPTWCNSVDATRCLRVCGSAAPSCGAHSIYSWE